MSWIFKILLVATCSTSGKRSDGGQRTTTGSWSSTTSRDSTVKLLTLRRDLRTRYWTLLYTRIIRMHAVHLSNAQILRTPIFSGIFLVCSTLPFHIYNCIKLEEECESHPIRFYIANICPKRSIFSVSERFIVLEDGICDGKPDGSVCDPRVDAKESPEARRQ